MKTITWPFATHPLTLTLPSQVLHALSRWRLSEVTRRSLSKRLPWTSTFRNSLFGCKSLNLLKTRASFGKETHCFPPDTYTSLHVNLSAPDRFSWERLQSPIPGGTRALEGRLGQPAVNSDLPDSVQNGPLEGWVFVISLGYSLSTALGSGHTEL